MIRGSANVKHYVYNIPCIVGKEYEENRANTELHGIFCFNAYTQSKVFEQLPYPIQKDKSDCKSNEHLIHGVGSGKVS